MVFSSVVFLFVFFPITYIVYKLLPTIRVKNGFLVLASLVFYAYGEPVYVLLILASVVVNYFFGRMVALPGKGRREFGGHAGLSSRNIAKSPPSP